MMWVIFIGDLIIDVGCDCFDLEFFGDGYVLFLVLELIVVGVMVCNFGIVGDCVCDFVVWWDVELMLIVLELLIVYVGVNDMWWCFDSDDFMMEVDFVVMFGGFLDWVEV